MHGTFPRSTIYQYIKDGIFPKPVPLGPQRHRSARARIVADGSIHRCDAAGRNGKGDAAYLLHLDGIPAGGLENWRDGKCWESWRFDIGRTLRPAELNALRVCKGALVVPIRDRGRASFGKPSGWSSIWTTPNGAFPPSA